MNQLELNSTHEFLYDLCKKVRKITLNGYKEIKKINYKIDGSPVTKFDVEADNIIRKIISYKFPNHNILSEENSNINNDSDYTWVIDPIDGTKSYVIGRPLWGTLIALIFKDKPILSVVDMPCLDEIWFGDNICCYLNKKKFKSNKNLDIPLSEAMMASTHPNLFKNTNYDRYNLLSKKVKSHLWSGDCHNYLLLANGGIDIVIEENLSSYDILPLIPILKSQNIYISDWKGDDITFELNKYIKYQVLASLNSNIHNEIISFFN